MTKNIIVALHGVGSNAHDMGQALQLLAGRNEIVALDGPEPFHANAVGRQWFSIVGVTEANRGARVSAALPTMVQMLDGVARDHGVQRDDLILLGFSQGAIMTLAAIAEGYFHGRAIAVAGRLAVVPKPTERPANLLLVHDRDDPVMPVDLSVDAGAALSRIGHHVDGSWTNGIGHGFGQATIASIDRWLTTNVSTTINETIS
jgi:phospholipase/carboxylesterase